MKKVTTILVLTLIGLFACKREIQRDPLVVGQWTGTEWLIGSQPGGMDAAKVRFDFGADGQYAAEFGTQRQKGTWHTDSGKLYTQENGKQEIMVKILRLDATHLDFEMNRGGQQETLRLEKK
jgi:hypothetical protein